MKRNLVNCLLGGLLLMGAGAVRADQNFTVDPSAPWVTWMNVSELPENGGAYLWGSAWGINDLVAIFNGPTLTLAPNSVDDPNPYWYTPAGGPGSTGNKWMDANVYQESSPTLDWSGQNITFSGVVSANSLVAPYEVYAFVKDFDPGYGSSIEELVPLTPGPFSVSLFTIPDPARHVQFGFTLRGPNVWITDAPAKGTVVIETTSVPSLRADFDLSGDVDNLDLDIWKTGFTNSNAVGDANDDTVTDGADVLIWQQELHPAGGVSAAPEPSAAVLVLLGSATLLARRRRNG
jgi:hypothetical protein